MVMLVLCAPLFYFSRDIFQFKCNKMISRNEMEWNEREMQWHLSAPATVVATAAVFNLAVIRKRNIHHRRREKNVKNHSQKIYNQNSMEQHHHYMRRTPYPSACIGQKINTSATHGLWSIKIFFSTSVCVRVCVFFLPLYFLSFQFLPSDSPSDFSFCCFMINTAYKACSSLFRSFYCLHLCVCVSFIISSVWSFVGSNTYYASHSHNNI